MNPNVLSNMYHALLASYEALNVFYIPEEDNRWNPQMQTIGKALVEIQDAIKLAESALAKVS